MASKRALGSFRVLLLCDSLPFFAPLPSRDKLHSSHSRLFSSRLQLLAWDHTGLTFRLPFFPSFYCFSAHSRAVSSLAFAHPHFFIASNKLLRSASKFSLFVWLLWEACHTFSATSFALASSTSFAGSVFSHLYLFQNSLRLVVFGSLGCVFHQSVTHPLTSISRGTHPSCHLSAKGGGAKVPEPRPNHVLAALLKAPQLRVLIVLVSPFMTVSSS